MPDLTETGTLLISMPEIAELAGVRRPVVTTWRRRHKDFPPPAVSQAGGPLFDARAVVAWLVGSGRAEQRQIEPDLRLTATRRTPRRPRSSWSSRRWKPSPRTGHPSPTVDR